MMLIVVSAVSYNVVCRTSKELNPLDDEVVIKMKAIIDTDVVLTGSVIILISLSSAFYRHCAVVRTAL